MTLAKGCAWMLCVLAVAICCGGCEIQPKYKRPGFDPQQMDRVVVLPFIDNRKNPDPKDNFNEQSLIAQDALIVSLRFKQKYRAVASSDVGGAGGYSASHLPVLPDKADKTAQPVSDTAWAKRLGPANARFVMVPAVDDTSGSFLLLYGQAGSTVSLYIFDKRDGQLVWANSGHFSIAGIGVLDAVVAASARRSVDAMAAGQATKALKKQGEPYVLRTDQP